MHIINSDMVDIHKSMYILVILIFSTVYTHVPDNVGMLETL